MGRFAEAMSQTLPLFLVLGWVFGVAMLIKNLVYEKEERLREVSWSKNRGEKERACILFLSSLCTLML